MIDGYTRSILDMHVRPPLFFCLRTQLARISAASPIQTSWPKPSSRSSNHCVLPHASKATRADRRDAARILKLLIEDRFPRLWHPSRAVRD